MWANFKVQYFPSLQKYFNIFRLETFFSFLVKGPRGTPTKNVKTFYIFRQQNPTKNVISAQKVFFFFFIFRSFCMFRCNKTVFPWWKLFCTWPFSLADGKRLYKSDHTSTILNLRLCFHGACFLSVWLIAVRKTGHMETITWNKWDQNFNGFGPYS